MKSPALVLVCAVFVTVHASMAPLGGFSGGLQGMDLQEGDPMATLFIDSSPYEGFSADNQADGITHDAISSNVNNVMDLLVGSQQSGERNAIHVALDNNSNNQHQPSSDHHSSHSHVSQHHHSSQHESSHHSSQHDSSHHSSHQHESSHHSNQHESSQHSSQHHESSQHSSQHHESSQHSSQHGSHHSSRHGSDATTSLIQEDTDRIRTRPPAPQRHEQQPHHEQQQQQQQEHHANAHLREELIRRQKEDAERRKRQRHAIDRHATKEHNDDDVPRDEFGLEKDCHWIQMDFTQNSDNCNQCMTVADAFFRGDNVCVCYTDKPGAMMRTSCNDMANKFTEAEDHIRELAVENQWNEYYKSYGLCENFGHCGS